MIKQNNKLVFRMSHIGSCPRALTAEYLQKEESQTPEFLKKAATEGKWHEDRICNELTECSKYHVFDRQQELKIEFDNFILLGHIDGKINEIINKDFDSYTRLLEIKSMSAYEFDRWMRDKFDGFPYYEDQLNCYLEGTGLNECRYIVKNRSSGYKDDFIVKKTEGKFQEIVNRLDSVTDYIVHGELYPGDFDLTSLKCKRCNFKKLCIPAEKKLDKASEEQVRQAIEYWKLSEDYDSKAKEFKKKASEVLKSETEILGLTKWQFENAVINKITVKPSIYYPTRNLTQHFTTEQLASSAENKNGYDFIRVDFVGEIDKEK